jgi:hypothetical protein
MSKKDEVSDGVSMALWGSQIPPKVEILVKTRVRQLSGWVQSSGIGTVAPQKKGKCRNFILNHPVDTKTRLEKVPLVHEGSEMDSKIKSVSELNHAAVGQDL